MTGPGTCVTHTPFSSLAGFEHGARTVLVGVGTAWDDTCWVCGMGVGAGAIAV